MWPQWPWPTTMFNRGILTGLYSNGPECRIQLNCRSVQRMRSLDSVISCQKWCAIKRMRVRGRLPPKLASYTYTKLPLKCTTKTYPKTVSTFSTSSLSIHVAKKLLGARFGSSSSLWCNLVSEAWRQAATALHSYPHKEIWYFHVAGGIPKVWGFGLLVCSPRCRCLLKVGGFLWRLLMGSQMELAMNTKVLHWEQRRGVESGLLQGQGFP